MTNKWIVFDVDDVICNFKESLYTSLVEIGKDIHWSKWNQYSHTIIYDMTESQLHLHMKNYNVIENSLLEPGVLELFNKLKKEDFKIGLLTARGWHNDGEKLTQEFVDKYKLPVDKIVISGFHTAKKSLHIDKFEGEVIAYVDDSIHHIQDFTEKNIPAFLLDRPWNQNSNLPRMHALIEFYDKINQLNNGNK